MSRFGPRSLPGRGDRVVVAGLGASGIAAIRQLSRLEADVVACDDAADESMRARATGAGAGRVWIGGMLPDFAQGAALVVVAPGVPPHAPLLQAARVSGVPVWSEVELGWRIADVPVIGVTGTNGKTTTTSMITAALNAAGIHAAAAGNIGVPLCDVARGPMDAIVAELSSFQLHHTVSFRPRVGVLLNLAPDHLDWHGSFRDYAADKMRLFARQDASDVAVVHHALRAPESPARLVRFGTEEPPESGAGVHNGFITVPEGRLCRTADLRVEGGAMLADAVAAGAAACAFGADPAGVAQGLVEFTPGEHRMEPVTTIGGVAFVNDSKATNPHATLAALDGMEGVVLIAGGQNKGLDLSSIAGASGVVAAVAIGDAAPQVEAAFTARGIPVVRATSMDEAVEQAAGLAGGGGTVLLSPACASFDMFADYKARGEAFRAAVKRVRSGGRQ